MTAGELAAEAERRLAEGGVPEAAANAEWILAHVLGVGRPAVRARSSRALSPKEERHARNLVRERAKRIPLAYVLGSQGFMGLELRVTPAVLIPRPETEELVLAAAEAARRALASSGAVQLLDVGTGSGCVSIALARLLPEAQIVATDISAAALALAEENALKHHLARRIRFLKADLFQPARRGAPWADVAVSNPPYIPSREVDRLEPEVLREPRLALDGGKDGLDAIRAIAADVPSDLKPGGRLALEMGFGQGPAVRAILERAGFSQVELRKDAQGVERIALARL